MRRRIVEDYLIKYSRYYLLLGLAIIILRVMGIEVRRLDSIPVVLQYATGILFLIIGLIGTKLKRVA